MAWEGFSSFSENKMYYVTVKELTQVQASRRHVRGKVESSLREPSIGMLDS